jgi:hypothetical protein
MRVEAVNLVAQPKVEETVMKIDRQDDQVGQDECKHAAEADAAVPQHGSEGYVSDYKTRARVS